jgi:glycosyltransferase involved in cell wall biosynthesis
MASSPVQSKPPNETRNVVVFGHYPPPITGERLCSLHLINRLCFWGFTVEATDKRTGIRRPFRPSAGWLILGSQWSGFLRDCLIAIRQRNLTHLYLYVHNASWRRLISHAWWLRPALGKKVTVVVLTAEISRVLNAAGWSSVVLRNTVPIAGLTEMAADPCAKRMIWMAAITEEKGFPEAYSAFSEVRAKDPDWTFDVYGTGLAIEPFPLAHFHGIVQGSAKLDAFRKGGIMILPSKYVNETQPLCLLEAMAAGLPVIASDVGGISEIIGTGQSVAGICVSDLNPGTISKAISDVNQKASLYGASARARFLEYFSPERFDQDLLTIMGIRT